MAMPHSGWKTAAPLEMQTASGAAKRSWTTLLAGKGSGVRIPDAPPLHVELRIGSQRQRVPMFDLEIDPLPGQGVTGVLNWALNIHTPRPLVIRRVWARHRATAAPTAFRRAWNEHLRRPVSSWSRRCDRRAAGCRDSSSEAQNSLLRAKMSALRAPE